MLKTIVLICATSVQPADCTPATALVIDRLPPTQGKMCGMGPTSSLTKIELRDGQYPKVLCERAGKTAAN